MDVFQVYQLEKHAVWVYTVGVGRTCDNPIPPKIRGTCLPLSVSWEATDVGLVGFQASKAAFEGAGEPGAGHAEAALGREKKGGLAGFLRVTGPMSPVSGCLNINVQHVLLDGWKWISFWSGRFLNDSGCGLQALILAESNSLNQFVSGENARILRVSLSLGVSVRLQLMQLLSHSLTWHGSQQLDDYHVKRSQREPQPKQHLCMT